MFQSLTLVDGALNQGGAQARLLCCLGVSTGGTANTPQLIEGGNAAYDAFGEGDLPDRIAFHFQNEGPGPVLAVKLEASTAGVYATYTSAVHAAFAGNDAANTFPGPITQPAVPRNVEIAFANGWDGGNVTVVGTDAAGAAQTEVITAVANSTVKGNRVFKSFTSFAKGAVGANAAAATVRTGNKSADGASTSNAQVAMSGTPLLTAKIVGEVTRNGSAAAGTSAVKISYDNGVTFEGEQAVPAGGVVIGKYGITLTFSGDAMKLGDRFEQTTVGPLATTGNLTAGIDALKLSPYLTLCRLIHIVQALTGSQAATVNGYCNDWRVNDGLVPLWEMETRDYLAGEAEATYQASLLGDWGGVVFTYGQGSVTPAGWNTVLAGSRGIQRRSFAWATVTKKAATEIGKHPGAPGEAGPLRGLYTPITGSARPDTHDERTTPGLGGALGRMCTVQSLQGREYQGQWFIGDYKGKRSPGTLASGGSDYRLFMHADLMMEIFRVLQSKANVWLAAQRATKKDGTLLESVRLKLNKEATAELQVKVVEPGYCQSASVDFSATERVLLTQKLKYTARARPFAYPLEVAGVLGFEGAVVL